MTWEDVEVLRNGLPSSTDDNNDDDDLVGFKAAGAEIR